VQLHWKDTREFAISLALGEMSGKRGRWSDKAVKKRGGGECGVPSSGNCVIGFGILTDKKFFFSYLKIYLG